MTKGLKQLWPYIAAQAEPLPMVSVDASSTTPFAGSGADIVLDAGAGGAIRVNVADASNSAVQPDPARSATPFPYPPIQQAEPKQVSVKLLTRCSAKSGPPYLEAGVEIPRNSQSVAVDVCFSGEATPDRKCEIAVWLRVVTGQWFRVLGGSHTIYAIPDDRSSFHVVLDSAVLCGIQRLYVEITPSNGAAVSAVATFNVVEQAQHPAQQQPPAISEEQIRKLVNDEITNRCDEIFSEALYKQVRNLISEEITHRCAEITEAKEHTAAVLRNWFALEVERLESIIREERKDAAEDKKRFALEIERLKSIPKDSAAEIEKLLFYKGSLVRVDPYGRVIHAASAEEAMVEEVSPEDGRVVTINCSATWPKPHEAPASSIVNTNHSVGNPELLTYATAVLDKLTPSNTPILPSKEESAEIEYTKQTAIRLSPGALISRIPPAFWHIIVWAAMAYLIVLAATKFPL